MFKIDDNTLYSRGDLAEALEPLGVDVDTFTARLRARKVFRACWLGSDLIEALRAAPALGEAGGLPPAKAHPARSGGVRHVGGGLDGSKFDRLIKG